MTAFLYFRKATVSSSYSATRRVLTLLNSLESVSNGGGFFLFFSSHVPIYTSRSSGAGWVVR